MPDAENCLQLLSVSKVLVEEGSRKACFLNPSREELLRAHVDGCLCHNVMAADFVVAEKHRGFVVIELKGKDIEHAIRQIIETARSHLSICKQHLCGCTELVHCKSRCKIAGLVVARQYPRYTTTVQKRKEEFAKLFRGPVHVVTKNAEFQLERVLQFDGPF
jgi:hypothetical protein